jgi:Glycosyltransferase family 87
LALIALSASGIQYSVGWCAALMILIVTSRPGYGTLFSGYFTFELAVATVLALHWGNRPGWGGAMLAVAACKPTYAIPLAIFMIARGHWRAVMVGVALAILGSAIIYFWLLPDRSWFFLLEDIRFGQSQHMADQTEMPEFSWTRVDIVAVIAKWLKANPSEGVQVAVFLVACLVPAFIVWRLRKHAGSENVSSLSGTISLLTMNALLYRHYYDLIVLVVPIFALAIGARHHREFSTWMRFVIAGLLLIALFNYGSTLSFFGRFGIEQGSTEYLLLTSLSGCALFAALILALATGLQRISQGHLLTVDSSSALP